MVTQVRGPAVGATVENPVVKTFSVNSFSVFSCLYYQLEYIHATRHQTHPGGHLPGFGNLLGSVGQSWAVLGSLGQCWHQQSKPRFFCALNKPFRADLIAGYE